MLKISYVTKGYLG